MSVDEVSPRFRGALERARSDWAGADPARHAASAGCRMTEAGVLVPFFGRPHLVTHPGGSVGLLPPSASAASGPPAGAGDAGKAGGPVHESVAIVILHYLLTADGTPPAGRWIAFRELPDGMFYAQAFGVHAEQPLAAAFGGPAGEGPSGLAGFLRAAATLGGAPLELADAAARFDAFPRAPLAVLLWAGDEEQPGEARVVFDAHAGHYLATEDAAGLGEWLAGRLVRAATRSSL